VFGWPSAQQQALLMQRGAHSCMLRPLFVSYGYLVVEDFGGTLVALTNHDDGSAVVSEGLQS
jgi:hypothetical protein